VPEPVIREAARAIQGRRLFLRFAAARYGITHTAHKYKLLKIQQL
jgi:hypothetical protein